ncbi:hypothetical protein C1645_840209 [Glomus cerebriforme]|uniref:Uncharacterized protein n=1 Tax=Glomus cerebriforme TaxID=658196 RepID=A0A397SA92_9GLOM|nr:hypothetical protein C1645_840209 [Glomus cerebriforme]
MSENEEKNKQLLNKEPNEIEKKITSPDTIDCLAGKLKEHNLGGIKLELMQNDTPIIQPKQQATVENPKSEVKVNQGVETSPQKSEKAVEIPANPATGNSSDANSGENI